MKKTKLLLIFGVLLLLEGYSNFLRGFLPVSMSAAFEDDAVVYMKVIEIEEDFNSGFIFCALGIICIALALFFANKHRAKKRDK